MLGDGTLGTVRAHFAYNLAAALSRVGLKTQQSAAVALGVSQPTLSAWLAGKKMPHDDAVWERLSTVLGVSYGDFLQNPDTDADPWLEMIRREAEAKGYILVKKKH
jgi:transcriptional regulator with XRE-family HTH domain